MSNNYYPFGPEPGNPFLAYLPYDLQIEKIDPGIILYPDEPAGVLTIFREVGGKSWWVVNADYNSTDGQWEQVAPANAANPAFAATLDSAGNFAHWVAAATTISGNPVVWVQVNNIDQYGNVTINPVTLTSQTQIIESLVATWNAGSSAGMTARLTNITDSSSSTSSSVDKIEVNGTPVWEVRKDGTLVVGMIPYSALILPNPWTINVPVIFADSATFNGPAVFTNTVTMSDGLTVTGGIGTDNLNVSGNETVGGNLQVNGTTTTNNLVVTGSATLPASAVPVTDITGSGGVVVTHTGTTWNADGSAFVETVESTDSSVTITRTGQTVNITAGAVAPVIPGSWFINTEFVAPIGTPQSGSVSLGPLPGTSSDVYRVVYWGVTGFKDANSNMVFTGTVASGITWDEATVTVFNGSGNATPFMYLGTAQGGTTPTVSWTTTDYVFATPFTATIAAGIQL